ncbi:acyltransferase family protein [Oxalicibacterium faecigallinarum]|uniref:Acyltransferase n=1 Tax=Oxalicibacterium faecigallinarum TaxID=573741 RepID=A0A8J3AJV7_9BURK|nr:acyltransferase [Oxalicibacterium faecigallinarum]GGI15912.1 acyltransferase [Oxalicibacterium faecigallinarum]
MAQQIIGVTPAVQRNRIDELESIRGIAALLVVIYHIPNWNAALFDLPLFRNSYLMVELFFVLSGFVIYKAYADNIDSPAKLARFQFLRFARLYPVHLLFLLVFLGMEIAKYIAYTHYGIKSNKTTPFVENDLTALVQQLFLIQAIGPTGNALTFNAPAWSISVEFYTYLLFSLIVLYMGRMKMVVFATLGIAACVVLAADPKNGFADLLSCLAGFFIGCCTAWASERVRFKLPSQSVALAVVLLLLYLQMKTPKQHDLWIYLFTAVLVLAIVLSDDGAIRRMLRLRFFLWLGTISYSIYMSHSALLWSFNQVHRFFFKRSEILIEGRMVPQLSFVQALLSYIVILALLLLLSHLVYRFIEHPLRERSRKVQLKMPAFLLGGAKTP